MIQERPMWTVPQAKSRLSEVLRRARAGEPQFIGAKDQCVIISAEEYQRLKPSIHYGRFLLESVPRGADLALPPRGTDRGDPFADDDPR
jgi:prevent-host-death family protein